MSSTSTPPSKSPLEAAQNIVNELAGMDPNDQFLAIKFSCETLKVQLPNATGQNLASAIGGGHHASTASTTNDEHPTDIRSFTSMKAPKSDQQFTAVVAYFYQFAARADLRKETIDAETMKEAARLAGRPQVERWNMTLTNAKNAGYLDGVGDGQFKLSSVGENLVAITLPDGAVAVPARRSKKVRKVLKKIGKKKG